MRLVCCPRCRKPAATVRPVRRFLLDARCFVLLALAGAGAAHADEFHGYATATTDYVFRGISQSNEGPSLQAGLDYASPGGFFAGLFVAGIDYPETRFRADSGNVEWDGYVGYSRPAGRDFAWDIALIHYDYPQSEADDTSYQELGFNLHYRDVARFGVTASDDARSSGASAWTAELELRLALGGHFLASGTLGHYAFSRSDWRDYRYFDLGLSATRGAWTFDLRWFGTSDEAESIAGPRLTRDRVVASVSIGF
jgi:uncharacterized protein (TIGR02001 family)